MVIDYSKYKIKTGGAIDYSKYKIQPPAPEPTFGQKALGVTKAIGGALISSEKKFGEDIAGALTTVLPKSWTGQKQLDEAAKMHADDLLNITKVIKTKREKGDTTGVEKWTKILKEEINNSPKTILDLYPALKKTNWQVVGDAGGVLLDILSAGSYGTAAKGAKTGQLLSKADKAAESAKVISELNKATAIAKNIETSGKFGTQIVTDIAPTLGSTLKNIGVKTATRSAIGGATGYGYDITGNLQEGKTGLEALKPGTGTLLGATVPLTIGGIQATKAVTKATAPRIINSLVRPKAANFSYGKNPGRTVSEMGITGNNLEDFGNKLNQAQNEVGQKISNVYSNSKNAKLAINASSEIKKLDDAITKAAKGGKNNQNIVNILNNIKEALLYEHGLSDGVITKIGDTPRDLSKLKPEELFELKKVVSEMTRFTGTPSDDKLVNNVLQDIYGGIKDKLNRTVRVNNPEIIKLNEQYGDLVSATLATKNRDKIVQASNLVGLKAGGFGAAGTVAALIAGTAALPAVLTGITVAGLEKALETTAVKSRIAAWLGKASPSVIEKVLISNPSLRPIFFRLVPNLGSKIGE